MLTITPNNTIINSTVFTGGTTGSVLFIGASGVVQQDNANFFWDDTNNRLGIGTITPEGITHSVRDWGSISASNLIAVYDSYDDANRFTIRRANGSVGSPTATASGDVIGNFNWRGHDGTNFSAGARAAINVFANETFTSTAQGTFMQLQVTPNGSTTGTEVMRITGDIKLGMNGPVTLKNYTVATLPTGTRGDICYVTDATVVVAKGVAPVAGGASVAVVFYNGAAWVGI